jgi:DNA-binding protein Fis
MKLKILLLLSNNLRLKFIGVFLFAISTSFSQLTVTKTYTGPASVTIDGCGLYCNSLPGVSFSAADFTGGYCQVTDVNVSITWAKTDGTCEVPGTGNSFHNESNFRIDGPTGNNVILVQPGSYSGNGSTPTTTTVLDQAAATVIGGVDPFSGTFQPNNGNLDTYNGTSAFGTWYLRAGDTGGGDPLCMVSYSVTITVSDDNIAPVPDVSSLLSVTDECSVTSLIAPTATDNCAGAVTGTHNAILPITAQGTTVVTWTYVDGNGNTSTQTQNVVITDITAPVADLAVLADVTAECEVTSLTNPSATDNCAGMVTISNDAVLPITAQGSTVVTWTYSDMNGNSSIQTQNIVITDVTAPVADFAVLADVTAECEVTSLTNPSATDNCAGMVTISNDAVLPITAQGSTVVTWTYSDMNGNSSTQTQNVVITDITGPVADLAVLADVTAECEVTSLTNPSVTDNCAGMVTISNDAVLPITAQGSTVVTWTYTDMNGNSSTQTQNVVITDITAPVADLAMLADVTAECEVTSLTNPSATDNCAGMVTVSNDAVLPITAQGSTVVTWTYSDMNGNSSTQTQNVVITDITAPVADVIALADVTATCEVTSLTDPTATDNCGGTVTVSNDAVFPISADVIVTWTYEDENGNTSTQTQQVLISVVDATVTVTGAMITANNTNPTVTYQWVDCDNGNASIAGADEVSFTATANGNYAVEVTEDGCTETSVCTQIDLSNVNELTAEMIKVYPNPASSVLNIETVSEGTVGFFDLSGKLILTQNVNAGTNELNIDQLATGAYTLRLTAANGTQTIRLMISK